MTTFNELQAEHDGLLDTLQHLQTSEHDGDENRSELINRVRDYVATLGKASSDIVWTLERNQVLAILRFWADFLFKETGSYPSTLLRPPDRDAIERARIKPLAALLRERQNLEALDESVREAEMLQAIGWLNEPEAVDALVEAQGFLERRRRGDSELLVDMRSARLSGVSRARDEIETWARGEEQVLFDPQARAWRPVVEILTEANSRYEELSSASVRQELAVAERFLPAHPEQTMKHLEAAVTVPLSGNQRRLLEEKLSDMESLVATKGEAQRWLEMAEESDIPLEKLGHLRRAEQIFPYLEGLSARISMARQTVLDRLTGEMSEHCQQAEIHLQRQDYEKSLEEILVAERLLAEWPDPMLPEPLARLGGRTATLRTRAVEGLSISNEFDEHSTIIRNQIQDLERRQAALELLRAMRDDPRFTGLIKFKIFLSEMDPYLGDPGEQLAQANLARVRGNWQRVTEITEKLLSSPRIQQSPLRQDAERLLTEATQELYIASVHRYLEEGRVGDADEILRRVLQQQDDPERQEGVRDRLQEDLTKIAKARDNVPMQMLHDQAVALEQRQSLGDQVQAWRLFQYIGGTKTVDIPENWPEYSMSMHTAEAREKAQKLAEMLRERFLEPIQRAWTVHQDRPPNDSDLVILARNARVLREARFPATEQASEAMRWAEVAQCSREGQALEVREEWDAAVELWGSLLQAYSQAPEARAGLQRARVKQVIGQASTLGAAAARTLLESSLKDPLLRQSWELYLALARAQAELGALDNASESLAVAERNVASNASIAAVEDTRQIDDTRRALQAIRLAEDHAQKGEFAQALLVLRRVIQQRGPNTYLLGQYRDRILDTARRELLRLLEDESADETDKAVIRRGVAAADLLEMEKIAEVQPGYPDPKSVLGSMHPSLSIVAEKIFREVENLNVTHWSLDYAWSEIGRLGDLLQSLARLGYLWEGEQAQRLVNCRMSIDRLSTRLQYLRSLLDEAVPLWDEAVQRGDFHRLENISERMQRLELGELIESHNFRQRLSAWIVWYEYLSRQAVSITEAFYAEDFDTVLGHLDQVDHHPPVVEYKNFQEYHYIHFLIGEKLQIVDRYADRPVELILGWEGTRMSALQREKEQAEWTAWAERSHQVMSDLAGIRGWAAHFTRGYQEEEGPGFTLRTQKEALEEVQTKARIALETIGSLLSDEVTDKSFHSKRARFFYYQGSDWQREAQEHLRAVDLRIEEIKKELADPRTCMPTLEEFGKAYQKAKQGEVEILKSCLKRAKRVGPEPGEESAMVEAYEQRLKDLEDHGPGFWQDLRNRITQFFKRLLDRSTEADGSSE